MPEPIQIPFEETQTYKDTIASYALRISTMMVKAPLRFDESSTEAYSEKLLIWLNSLIDAVHTFENVMSVLRRDYDKNIQTLKYDPPAHR